MFEWWNLFLNDVGMFLFSISVMAIACLLFRELIKTTKLKEKEHDKQD